MSIFFLFIDYLYRMAEYLAQRYVLRHATASNMLNAGIPILQVSSLPQILSSIIVLHILHKLSFTKGT
ncbi:MAG: hypothetical protein K8R40_00250 [Anaerolineaceae bacterium]|nr:hypothetical protein [Anaerolineaceae bacterium]